RGGLQVNVHPADRHTHFTGFGARCNRGLQAANPRLRAGHTAGALDDRFTAQVGLTPDLDVTGTVADVEVAVHVGIQQLAGYAAVVAAGGAGETVAVVAAVAFQTGAIAHLVIEGVVIPGCTAEAQTELALVVPAQLAVPVDAVGHDVMTVIGTGA